jgi:hypothetical protein
MEDSTLRHDLAKDIETFRRTSNTLVEMLKKGNLEGIEDLAREHDESFRRIVAHGPFANHDDREMLIDLKEVVDRTRDSLEEKKELVFSKIVSFKKKRQCVKAYDNRR